MTSTAVGLGLAMLGTPDEAAPDCDCAAAAAGSTDIRRGIMKFIGIILSIFSLVRFLVWLLMCSFEAQLISSATRLKITTVLYWSQKNLPHSWVKLFTKNFLASDSICSRLWGDEVTRTLVNTPAILESNN